MKALRLVGIVCAGLLAVLMLALLWLTLTAGGLRTGLALTARLVPGELRWDAADGRLVGPLVIRGLQFTGEAGDYRLERLALDWSPAALSTGTLRVDQLHLEDARLAPAPAPAAPEDAAPEFTLPDIRLPLRIVLRDIRLERLEFIPPEGQSQTLEHLYLDAGVEAQQLQLEQLDLALAGIGLQASGTVALTEAGESQLAFHWQAELPDLPLYAGTGELSGNREALRLTHRLERPAAATLELRLLQPLAALQWSLDLSLPETALNTFAPSLPPQSLALALQAEGDPDQARFEARLDSDHPQLQGHPLELQGRASRDGWTDYRLDDAELRLADSRLQLAGHWSQQAGRGRLELDWPALHWPPAAPAFSARRGNLVWEGGLEAFSLNLESVLAGESLPEAQLELQGRGDAAGFDLTRLQAGLLGGEVQADGRFGWGDGLDWQLQLAARGIDPGRHWPDWPGELAARIKSSGDMRNEALTARVTLQTLDGRLRGLPLSGGGRFESTPGGWRFTELELRTGDNRLALNGGPGMPEGLVWQLDFPNLAASLPGVNGALRGQGRLSGDWPQLRARGAIEVQELGLAQLTLGRTELDFDAGLDGVSGPTNINLNGNDWAWQGRELKTVTASLDGTLADHRLRLEASGPGHDLRLALTGGWADPDWRGRLAALDWELPETGAWTLSEPVEVTAGRETARLAPACWTQATAGLCLEGRADQAYAAWQAEAGLDGLPLNRLQPWLPVGVEFDSSLSVRATAVQQAGRLRSEGEIRIPAGTVAWGEGEGQQRLPRGEAEAVWQLDATGLQARARVGLLEQDQLTARLELPGLTPGVDPEAQPVEGNLQGDIRRLEVIELFVPAVARVEGRLRLDTRIRGSLAAPEFDIGTRLSEAALWVPAAGIRLEEVTLSLDSAPGGRLQLQGGARSGAGRIDLNGELGFRDVRDWTARLALQGEDFLVLDLPEARLPVSPDLELQVQPPRIDLTGSVHVPQARLEPRDFSGAVGPSRDVVVVTDRADPTPGWQVHARVRLSLGEAVMFEGYGLSGRLAGQLELIDQPGQLTRARGELQVVDGSYTAYGQVLEITRGRVIYSGGPVDDPAIDATAVRRVDEVTAGIRLGGYLQQPELELFSRPSMAEADVLSYLMLGRPVAGASGAEGQLLLRAATAMGVKGGDALAGQIGERLGLDEVSVSGGETAQDAALVLGKYLSPRLYVNYSVGLFDSLSTLNLRYELSRRWSLESEVGVETGADLLFNIER